MALGLAGLRRHPILLAGNTGPELIERLAPFFELEMDNSAQPARLLERLPGKSAVLLSLDLRMDADFLAQFPQLKVVCRIGPGQGDIDLAACTRAEVIVTDTPALGESDTAQRAMGMIAADNLIAAFGFGRIGGHPPNLLNTELRCTLGCCL